MVTKFTSTINTNLPLVPGVEDPDLNAEFQTVYNAIQALHVQVDSLTKNVANLRIFVGAPPYP